MSQRYYQYVATQSQMEMRGRLQNHVVFLGQNQKHHGQMDLVDVGRWFIGASTRTFNCVTPKLDMSACRTLKAAYMLVPLTPLTIPCTAPSLSKATCSWYLKASPSRFFFPGKVSLFARLFTFTHSLEPCTTFVQLSSCH